MIFVFDMILRGSILLIFLSAGVCAQQQRTTGGGDGGSFGEWVTDAGGMPAFDYTLDQTSPTGAKIARAYHDATHQSDWRDPRDNLFELGNDRLVVVASTFGYVQVRQDERGPKFLQDVNPPSHQEGGGIVYVVDTESRELLASTYFTGDKAKGGRARRRFGIGYMSVASQAAAPHSHQGGSGSAQKRSSGAEKGACKLSQAVGCYNDTDCQSCAAGPVLPAYQPALHDKVTRPACAAACHGLGYTLAGIDAGNHCFCGNASDLNSAAAKARSRPAGECQASPCHADLDQRCGGDGRLLAYSFVCDGPAPPVPPSPPASHGISLHHELFAPFGDDPVILSALNLTSSAHTDRNISVITVWGTQMYQLQQCSATGGASCPSAQRRAFQLAHYNTTTRTFLGPHDPPHLVSVTTSNNVSAVQPTHWDATPPETFLVAIPTADESIADVAKSLTFGCDAAGFYGTGGAAAPALRVACGPASDNGAIVLERRVLLPAGGNLTLHSGYGYAPSGFFVDKLIEKYGTAAAVQRARAVLGLQWMQNTIGFSVPKNASVEREVRWNAGYLRQALTFYDFFNESVLDQGSQYRYGSGFEGAARDPLQHALPLIHSAPERAASVLRMQLQTMVPEAAWGPPKPAGPYSPGDDSWNTAYALYGSGMVDDMHFGVQLGGASDLEIYLLLLSAEYLLATKDAAFLQQRIPFRYKKSQSVGGATDRSALEAIVAAYHYLVNHTSVGQHGLIRVQSGDWNDGFSGMACGKDAKCQQVVQAQAESIMNSAMSGYVMERFAQALELCKVPASVLDSAAVRRFGAAQTAAVRQWGWNGQWVNRAWLPKKGFVGTDAKGDGLGITLEPQPWVLLSGMLSTTEESTLLRSIESLSCELGWKQSKTGHMWAALSHPMVMGVARVNKTLAWNEWNKASLANEATNHPTMWPGVWTSADYIRPDSGCVPRGPKSTYQPACFV